MRWLTPLTPWVNHDALHSCKTLLSSCHCPFLLLQDWDVLCLSELQAAQQAAGSQRVVLSTYPLGYTSQGAAAAVPDQAPATLLCAKGFDDNGLLHIQSR